MKHIDISKIPKIMVIEVLKVIRNEYPFNLDDTPITLRRAIKLRIENIHTNTKAILR